MKKILPLLALLAVIPLALFAAGGGVITIIPNQAISASHPGYLQVSIKPNPGAYTNGAGWKLNGDAAFSGATNYTRAVLNTNPVSIVFRYATNYDYPTNLTLSILPDVITVVTNASYIQTNFP